MPAVPLLALSVGALAVFYTMPTRFNAWLSRLPGDDILRTALIFAPATLLAIVVMAVLYANDAPRREGIEATRPSRARRALQTRRRGGLARASLWLSLPALMLVAAAHLVAFVAPERMDRWLDFLPATAILTRLFEVSPYVVLAAVGVGMLLGFAPAREEDALEATGARGWTTPRVARLGALLILVPSLGLLALTAAGLVWISLSSESLAWLAERLPTETLLRLGLMFSPAMLLGLVLLAGLYLAAPMMVSSSGPPPGRPAVPGETAVERGERPIHLLGAESGQGLRSGLAMAVLVAGMGFTALAGMATLVALVFVLVSR